MGKGAGSAARTPIALAGGAESDATKFREQAEREILGDDWRYRAAMQAAANHPDVQELDRRIAEFKSSLKQPEAKPKVRDKKLMELERKLRIELIKNPNSEKAKQLLEQRKQLERQHQQAEEDLKQQLEELVKQRELLIDQLVGKPNKSKTATSGGELDMEKILDDYRAVMEEQILLRQLELEAAAQAKEKIENFTPTSYHEAVPVELFGLSVASRHHNEDWLVTEDGQVIYVAGMVDRIEERHLGVPLQEALDKGGEQSIGLRYWVFDKKGRLDAPLGRGCGVWAPGINKSACSENCNFTGCSCGLYAFRHDGKSCGSTYFDEKTCDVEGGVVGAVLLWGAVSAWGTAVRAQYAAPAAFAMPPGVSKKRRQQIEQAAKLYRVEVVAPDELYQAAQEFAKNVLPTFASG